MFLFFLVLPRVFLFCCWVFIFCSCVMTLNRAELRIHTAPNTFGPQSSVEFFSSHFVIIHQKCTIVCCSIILGNKRLICPFGVFFTHSVAERCISHYYAPVPGKDNQNRCVDLSVFIVSDAYATERASYSVAPVHISQ